MKIVAKQTQEFLKAPQQNVFGALIFGADEGQALNYSRDIIRLILGEHYEPTSLIELDDAALKSDPAKLADELGAMSLLGDKRLVWLRGVTEKSAEIIEQASGSFSKDCYLLATAGDLPTRNKLRALFEQRKDLAAVACYRLEGNQLALHIRGLIEAEGFRIDRQVVDMLVTELGNDQAVTQSEINKLCLYAHGQAAISLEDVEATILHNDQHQIDHLAVHFCDQNGPAFDTLWQHFMQDGEQPIVLLRSLSRYISRLMDMKMTMEQQGLSAEDMVQTAKPPIFWKQQASVKRHLSRFRLGELVLFLHTLNQAEAAFKSSALPPHLMVSYILEQRMQR